MTAPQAPEQAPGETAAATCPRCGAPVRADQDWCLSCGTALTTHVAGAPGWRTPVAIVGAVLAVAAIALLVAFLEISDDAEQEVAQAPTPTATATPSPEATATPGPGATATATPDGSQGTATPDGEAVPEPGDDAGSAGDGFESWPDGRTAYTVILASETDRAAAERKAERFRAGGEPIGILTSDDYESLRPGYEVVFSGQYDDLEAAQAAAERLRSQAPDAYARRIDPK